MADTEASKGTPEPRLRPKQPLDEQFYGLDEQELQFFKSWTGIADEEALKRHILDIQKDAYEVITFDFTKPGAIDQFGHRRFILTHASVVSPSRSK